MTTAVKESGCSRLEEIRRELFGRCLTVNLRVPGEQQVLRGLVVALLKEQCLQLLPTFGVRWQWFEPYRLITAFDEWPKGFGYPLFVWPQFTPEGVCLARNVMSRGTQWDGTPEFGRKPYVVFCRPGESYDSSCTAISAAAGVRDSGGRLLNMVEVLMCPVVYPEFFTGVQQVLLAHPTRNDKFLVLQRWHQTSWEFREVDEHQELDNTRVPVCQVRELQLKK